MNKAFTGEPEPPVLDVDNLSVSTSVLQHDAFGGDAAFEHYYNHWPDPELERHTKRMADLGEPIQEPFDR